MAKLCASRLPRDELPRALSSEMAAEFARIFKALGFKFVTLDLEGLPLWFDELPAVGGTTLPQGLTGSRPQKFAATRMTGPSGVASYEIILALFPMYRRFLVTLLRRSILVLVLVCLGCSAQLAPVPSDLTQKIERQVRATYSIPASVKMTVGPLRPSDFPNYDALTITIEGRRQEVRPTTSSFPRTARPWLG